MPTHAGKPAAAPSSDRHADPTARSGRQTMTTSTAVSASHRKTRQPRAGGRKGEAATAAGALSVPASSCSAPRLPLLHYPEILVTVAQWLTRAEITQVLCTSKSILHGSPWEYVWELLVRQRAGLTAGDIEELYEAVAPKPQGAETAPTTSSSLAAPMGPAAQHWGKLLRHLMKRHPSHPLTCFRCRKSPITGPVYSCMYCFGPHVVICDACEPDVDTWHPIDHVLIKWPAPYDAAKQFLHKGRFRYTTTMWSVYESGYTHDYQVECAGCKAKVEKLCVRCTTCAGTPVLCLRCGVGDRGALDATPAGVRLTDALVAAETALKMSFPCGPKGSACAHAGHELLVCPVIKFPPRYHGATAHTNCICDVCDKKMMLPQKRFRCAKCLDYDRCERCQRDTEAGLISTTASTTTRAHPKKHPMMVLRHPAQREQVAADTEGHGIMQFFLPNYEAESSSDSESASGSASTGSASTSLGSGDAMAWMNSFNHPPVL